MEHLTSSKHAAGLYKNDKKTKLTICEVHRRLYNKLKDTGVMTEEIRYLLEQGFVTGKKMHYRLAKYKHNWSDDDYKNNLDSDKNKIAQNQPIKWKYKVK